MVTLNLPLDLSEAEIQALAQFVKRVSWSEFSQNAVNEAEAYEIAAAVGKLQRVLAEQGYAPR